MLLINKYDALQDAYPNTGETSSPSTNEPTTFPSSIFIFVDVIYPLIEVLNKYIENIYVGDEGTSGPFFWNFWEDPQYFSLDYLL